VMENGENSPDEFFGSRRMTGIASGVTGMLLGQQPPAPTSTSTSLWVVYGVVVGIIALQVSGIASSLRTIRGWRADPMQRPTGALRIGLRVGLPLLLSRSWALIVLVGLPRIISASLPAILAGLPDLGYPLVASAVLAFGWGLARAIWAIRTLRTPAPGVRSASRRHLAQLNSRPVNEIRCPPSRSPPSSHPEHGIRRHPDQLFRPGLRRRMVAVDPAGHPPRSRPQPAGFRVAGGPSSAPHRDGYGVPDRPGSYSAIGPADGT
jgi:hypothetical protein